MKFSPIFDRHAQHLKVLSCDKGYVKCETVPYSAISAQLWTSQNVYKVPPNGDLQKKLLCCISRPNGLQNKIFKMQTQLWQNQARSQVLRFGGAKQILIVIICLKQIFLSTTKFEGH